MNDVKILVTRNIDCSTITVDEFISALHKDFQNAIIAYNEYWYPIHKARHDKWMESYRQSVLTATTKYAEKKWKTEKKRQAYINMKMSEIVDNGGYFPHLTYFDFDVNPLDNGLPDACCIRCDVINDDKLVQCFELIKNNKYFKSATGWILEDHHNSRPQIKLILPKDVQKEWDKDENTLYNAISNFYKDCYYYGD